MEAGLIEFQLGLVVAAGLSGVAAGLHRALLAGLSGAWAGQRRGSVAGLQEAQRLSLAVARTIPSGLAAARSCPVAAGTEEPQTGANSELAASELHLLEGVGFRSAVLVRRTAAPLLTLLISLG